LFGQLAHYLYILFTPIGNFLSQRANFNTQLENNCAFWSVTGNFSSLIAYLTNICRCSMAFGNVTYVGSLIYTIL
jgi:hypothetical protein